MIGPTELLLALGAFLLFGGGGAGVWLAKLKRVAAAKAREAVQAEIRRSVPSDVRELARQLGRPIDGDVRGDDRHDDRHDDDVSGPSTR